jgi:hypothetical protein
MTMILLKRKINLHIKKSIEQGLGGNMLIGPTTCPLKALFKNNSLANEDDMVEQDWLFTNNIIKIKI